MTLPGTFRPMTPRPKGCHENAKERLDHGKNRNGQYDGQQVWQVCEMFNHGGFRISGFSLHMVLILYIDRGRRKLEGGLKCF